MQNINIISILFLSTMLVAQDDQLPEKIVDTTIYSQVDASLESIEAQARIDKLDEESKKIYYQYKDTLAEYKGLKNYDDQLEKIVFSQQDEIKSLISQIDSLDETNKDILPFLKRMIDALTEFIKLDIPFLYESNFFISFCKFCTSIFFSWGVSKLLASLKNFFDLLLSE